MMSTTKDILARLDRVPRTAALRSDFIYHNVMYQVAGEVVAAASGMPWERFITTRILMPLGMTRSRAILGDVLAERDANASSAHFDINDRVRPRSPSPRASEAIPPPPSQGHAGPATAWAGSCRTTGASSSPCTPAAWTAARPSSGWCPMRRRASTSSATWITPSSAPTLAGRLEHWHFDTFRTRFGDGRGGWSTVGFTLALDGSIGAVVVDDPTLTFLRVPPPKTDKPQ